MNRFIVDFDDIIILGEKENQDVKSNSLNDSVGGIANDNDNEDTTKSLNGRMDSKGRIHDPVGKFMTQAGFTKKPSLTTVVEEATQEATTSEDTSN